MIAIFILGAVLFISLVLIHEWGHFIAARKNGVDVEEFGLGFPPLAKIITKKNGTVYSLNWLPLGGFVRLKGEHDSDKGHGTFGAASFRAKMLIMVAGVGMNLVTAYVLFTIVALIGMPNLSRSLGFEQFSIASDSKITRDYQNKGVIKVATVVDDSPAAKAGLKAEDEIISINGVLIDQTDTLSQQTSANAGKEVEVAFKRGDAADVARITLNNQSPYLGVASFSDEYGIQLRRSTWSAPIVAGGVMKDITIATLKGLGTALKGLGSLIAGGVTGNKEARQAGQTAASSQVAGPVGIVQTLYEGSRLGFGFMLFIIAVISLTLAIMNILPIPALDGGRLYTMLLFRLFKKPLTQNTEEKIQIVGFMIVLSLILLTTMVDISRLRS
ncbi:PDZ domain-containing protein [bacterium]|jgi:regulator of sigma E protease|nr:PDZ domain-containing protein [bacterium]NBX97844.1 PDZ domain-containing protein [bacterium]NDC94303.1 PDZ domain-containing protein [bacterium]NDD84315.1 PDZ domain-containing protein [bacterium]NDG28688.1 PDZ domain-containing protein [bacterium]